MNFVGCILNRIAEALELVNRYMPSQAIAVARDRDYDRIVADIEMDWPGWAVPAIMTELTIHEYHEQHYGGGFDRCECGQVVDGFTYWADHVAPFIAARIGCDPQRAARALKTYQPTKV